jgi:hypothetical protein
MSIMTCRFFLHQEDPHKHFCTNKSNNSGRCGYKAYETIECPFSPKPITRKQLGREILYTLLTIQEVLFWRSQGEGLPGNLTDQLFRIRKERLLRKRLGGI